MRKSTLLLAIGIATFALATAATAAAPPLFIGASGPPTWEQLTYKKLDDQGALERLQHSNPRHYAIARRILAAANEICDASQGGPIPTKFDARDIACLRSLWLASNPPKRQLSFRIDDTVYSALVIADTHATLTPIH
jgi:hypothetical protein